MKIKKTQPKTKIKKQIKIPMKIQIYPLKLQNTFFLIKIFLLTYKTKTLQKFTIT